MIKVHGVGVNDSLTPVTKNAFIAGKWKQVWACPYYMRWKDLLRRCYSLPDNHKHFMVYKDCSVTQEWLIFSNFKAWMSDKDLTLCLDKDILVLGNKIYSPTTCVMIPNYVNCLLTDSRKRRGTYPLGVSLKKKKKSTNTDRYQAYCHTLDKVVYLGYHDSPIEAHKAWQKQKILSIEKTIEQYEKESYCDSRVVAALQRRIEILNNDILNGNETIRI
uniref:HNH endonuclease n=1 Tax=Klebsiella phage FKP3 TaxID=3231233 RepID=A0AAU8HZF0_9CAUD